MQDIKSKIEELNAMALQGKALEAFDKFYHDEVIMQENGNPPTVGKVANRKREEEFFSSITEFRGAEVLGLAVNENISFVTWKYDYTHKDWGVRNYTQVAMQIWKDGKIAKEQFFYAN